MEKLIGYTKKQMEAYANQRVIEELEILSSKSVFGGLIEEDKVIERINQLKQD